MSVFTENHKINQTLEHEFGRTRPVEKPVQPPIKFELYDRVKFYGDRFYWDVKAINHDGVVLTRRQAFGAADPLYCIVYWPFGWRGPHNSWGYGAETLEECQDVLRDLHKEDTNLEMSVRNSIYLDLQRVRRNQKTIWEDA